jgi:methyl-accepting chemotaxis protein
MNHECEKLMLQKERCLAQAIPGFKASGLSSDSAGILSGELAAIIDLNKSKPVINSIEKGFGESTLRITASAVTDDNGDVLGGVFEWNDRTARILIQDEIQNIVGSSQAGDLSQRINIDNKAGFLLHLSTSINNLIDVNERVINESIVSISALASGNLTKPVTTHYEGAFGQLTGDINRTITKLSDVMQSINESANRLENDSNEISESNMNLSERTERQASSLEETASSMEQMTASVRQNADNAGQAKTLVIGASETATQGGGVVNDAVSAMQEITESSKKISDIIGVIDEIAFQTNLLALNAAVEAARAGEQGRGFAVVASEVRNLAGRSATAAKEIKTLIGDSVGKVEEGSRLVNESGKTLDNIVDSIKEVNAIVSEIAAASQEQSDGIEQVNTAISQMDEMTQQNAALVEQAAAASEGVGSLAKTLSEMVGFFNFNAQDTVMSNFAESGMSNASNNEQLRKAS